MISKYPIEISDQEGIADAVNYLLSGPAGLGQNFGGISAYNAAIIRPTFFRPFTLPYTTSLDASWYLRLPATGTTVVGGNPSQFITIDFGTGPGYTSPPFQFGDRLNLTGFTPSFWDDNYTVYSSTTTSVTLVTRQTYTWPPVTVLGDIVRDYSNYPISTDCLSQVKINSAQDRVFITAQVEFDYTINEETSPPLPTYDGSNLFDIVVQVNRYTASLDAQGNTVYNFQDTVSQKIIPESVGSPTVGFASAIFTTIVDQQLQFGSYAYILEISFVTKPTLSNGTTPGLSGFRTTQGSLVTNGFQTAPLPRGVAVGNLQVQSFTPGTTFYNVVPTVISSNNPLLFVLPPLVDVTVYPDILTPLYTVGEPGATPAGTVEIKYTRTLSNVQIVGTGGQFTCDARGLRVGDQIRIVGVNTGTGTITGYTNPKYYNISATNGSTTFTLQDGTTPIVTTAGTTTGLTFEYSINGSSNTNDGYQPGDVIKISGTDLGGSSPLNDLYLTVFNTSLNSKEVPGKFTMGLRNLSTQVIKN